jgi:ABC-type Fe3+ transport system permease subunit
MRVTVARVVVLTAIAAVAVFCIVQDRVTAAGAQRYVRVQREAIAREAPLVTIDGVLRPAVHQSVVDAGLAAGVVILCGAVGAIVVARRSRRG